jgi:hypothetical protein
MEIQMSNKVQIYLTSFDLRALKFDIPLYIGCAKSVQNRNACFIDLNFFSIPEGLKS